MKNRHRSTLIALIAVLALCPAAGNEQLRSVSQGERIMWLKQARRPEYRRLSTFAPAGFCSGLIDDVRVYDRAVTP